MITSKEEKYVRKVDKRQIPTCNIMGVNIAAINMEWLLEYLDKNIDLLHGDYICVSELQESISSLERQALMNYHSFGILSRAI